MKFVVGIDLGTTNSAVAYARLDEDRGGGVPPVRSFAVPQLVAPGEVEARELLPSFLYLAGEHDLPAAATALPWDPESRVVVGTLARTQGARVPSRLVTSAKSWLCHDGVDRHAAILPWGAEDVPRLSPVEAQARILGHVARAWQHTMGCALAEQEVVITVPASFDEVARELTAEAAASAGLGHATLLEEPQAVFYAWIDSSMSGARRAALGAGKRVLVCDVGGGTTDFTLIAVREDGDTFERTAVGDHVLLGGDNVDVALARIVEGRVGKLDAVRWHGLVHACRMAKEQMLSDESRDSVSVTVAARGSKLIGSTVKDELRRDEVEALVLDGFFPIVERGARPRRGQAGLTEFGLPFAADAAVTRHLSAFLGRHGADRVDAVMFNGGATRPRSVRARVREQIEVWQGDAPAEIANDTPDLAVARGAAYYGLVRRGMGSRIRGGAARAYYVGVEGGKAVCVLPRGVEEGTEHELAQSFEAVMNRPASFKLYSASARQDDIEATVDAGAEGLLELPPLVTVLRARGRARARVRVRTRLTELGTLELWCADADSGERWRLSFDLRAGTSDPAEDDEGAAAAPQDPRATEARELLRRSFVGEAGAPDPMQITEELERVLDARRDEWSTATIRALWDGLYEAREARKRSAQLEGRWLHLAGFLLRPGIGAQLDDWRLREMWKIFNEGLAFEKDEACRLAWWIVWRRVAGGLRRGQQEQIYDRIAPLFLPGARQKSKWYKKKPSPQETAEMWRILGALERLPPDAKRRLGEALLDLVEAGKAPEVAFWTLGRLGGRAPLYGPADTVVSPTVADGWVTRMLRAGAALPAERVVLPVAQVARRTGDRARDLPDARREEIAAHLEALQGGARAALLVREVIPLESREERVVFGDSLPAGLRRVEPDAEPPP